MIDVQELSFSYQRQSPVLQGLTFHVGGGEVFGILGPSGAGKSTLLKLLIGLLPRYRGTAKVMGQHCDSLKRSFFSRVGVGFETPALYESFTARENLQFFSALYDRPCYSADELLARLGLQQAASMRVSAFSRGMKSRLSFAKAIINNPDLIILDEPSTGLDPASATGMNELILALRQQGKTIVLCTHRMEDAAKLCDRVAFLYQGQVKAMDAPHKLIMAQGATTLSYTYRDGERERAGTAPMGALGQDAAFQQLMQGNRITSMHTNEPTLADVFVKLTGGRLEP